MVEPEALPTEAPPSKKLRAVSGTKFAASSLADSVAVAEAIHRKGGGRASHDQLAAFLAYKSSNNGSYLDRVASARMFGLVEGTRGEMSPTRRAETILMPEYPEDVRPALVDAFMDVPLFQAIYEDYHGKELPPEFGLKNAMRTRYAITPSRVSDAYRSMMESADTAGLFEVKGSRTQLIIPTMPGLSRPPTLPQDDVAAETEPLSESGGGGGGGGGGRKPPTPTRSDLQNDYVSTLIGILRDKGAKGEVDADLMERIEKLLKLAE